MWGRAALIGGLILLSGCGSDNDAPSAPSSVKLADELLAEQVASAQLVIERDRALPENQGSETPSELRLDALDSLTTVCDETPESSGATVTVICGVNGESPTFGSVGAGYRVTYRIADQCFDAVPDEDGETNDFVVFFHYSRLSTCSDLSADEIDPIDPP